MTRRRDHQFVATGRQDDLARHRAEVTPLDAGAAGHRALHLDAAWSPGEAELEPLVRCIGDRQRGPQGFVARAGDLERIAARAGKAVFADAQRRAPAQLDAAVRGLRDDRDRAARRQEPGRQAQQRDDQQGGDRRYRAAPRGTLRGRAPERDRLDAFVVVVAAPCDDGNDGRLRRHGQVAAAAVLDVDHAYAVAHGVAQAPACSIDDVALPQPRGPRHRHTVDPRRLVPLRRLQEQLAVVQRDPADRVVAGARQRHGLPGTAEAHREILSRQRTFAERIAQDQFGRAQMRSSQRTTSVGGDEPGIRFSSLRTSRKPWRVPTTV